MLADKFCDVIRAAAGELSEQPANTRLAPAFGVARVRLGHSQEEIREAGEKLGFRGGMINECDCAGATLPDRFFADPSSDPGAPFFYVVTVDDERSHHFDAVPIDRVPVGEVSTLKRCGEIAEVVDRETMEAVLRKEQDPGKLVLGPASLEARVCVLEYRGCVAGVEVVVGDKVGNNASRVGHLHATK